MCDYNYKLMCESTYLLMVLNFLNIKKSNTSWSIYIMNKYKRINNNILSSKDIIIDIFIKSNTACL